MKRILGTILILWGCVGLAAAATYDYNAEFDLSNNPSGVWMYGYADMSTGGMTLYNSHTPVPPLLDNWCYNDNPDRHGNANINMGAVGYDRTDWADGMSWEPGMTCIMSPALSGLAALAVFTAPTTADYDVSIEFTNRVMNGNPSNVFVVLNGNLLSPLFNDTIDGFPGSSQGAPPVAGDWTDTYTATLSLTTGDTIAFGVYGMPYHQVAVEAIFTEVPEPTTMGLLACGVLGMLLRRRK